MKIQHNISSLNIYRNLTINQKQSSNNLEKLATGFKINRAADDAAGLAISEKMRSQIRGLNMAQKNVQDGISLVQTVEGALHESQAILQRMRELAIQSANDTNVAEDRQALQNEVKQLTHELLRIADTTEFNTKKLLDGSLQNNIFQVGANSNQMLSISIEDVSEVLYKHSQNGMVAATPGNGNGGKLELGGKVGTWEEKITVEENVNFSYDPQAKIWTRDDNSVVVKDKAMIAELDAQNIPIESGGIQHDFNKFIVTSSLEPDTSYRVTYLTNNAVVGWFNDNGDLITESVLLEKLDYHSFGSPFEGEIAYVTEVPINTTLTYPNIAKLDLTTREVGYFEDSTGDLFLESEEDLTIGHNIGDKVIVSGGINVTTQEKANNSIVILDEMISSVSNIRSNLGAIQNRLEHTFNNLGATKENLTSSESRIRDTDMAEEMLQFTKNNILMQVSQAMLAQANQHPQLILQLLH